MIVQGDGVSAVGIEEMVSLDVSIGMRASNTYKPRTWRWLNAKQATNKSFAKVIDKNEAFCFRPYSYTPQDYEASVVWVEKRGT